MFGGGSFVQQPTLYKHHSLGDLPSKKARSCSSLQKNPLSFKIPRYVAKLCPQWLHTLMVVSSPSFGIKCLGGLGYMNLKKIFITIKMMMTLRKKASIRYSKIFMANQYYTTNLSRLWYTIWWFACCKLVLGHRNLPTHSTPSYPKRLCGRYDFMLLIFRIIKDVKNQTRSSNSKD